MLCKFPSFKEEVFAKVSDSFEGRRHRLEVLSNMYGDLVKMRSHLEIPLHRTTDRATVRPLVHISGFLYACIVTQRIAIFDRSFLSFDVNLTSLQITLKAARRPTYLLTPAPPAARPLIFCHCFSKHSLLPKTSSQFGHTHYKLRFSFHLQKTASPTFTTSQFPSADTSGGTPVCEYTAGCLSHKCSSTPFLLRRHNP